MVKGVIKKYKSANVEVKASFAYTVCNILQKSISFITLPLFTRLLTTEQYGQVTIYTSWEALLTLFITLYLSYGSFSTAMTKFEDRREEYLAAVNGLCITLAALFLVIYLPFRNSWNCLFELPTFIIVVMVISIVFGNTLQCWYGKVRFEYRYKSIFGVTLAMSILSLVLAFSFIMMFQQKGYAKILGSAFITILFGAGCFLYFFVKEKVFYHKEFWKYALCFNIPLIPYYLSQSIFNQSDRIIISHMEGQDKAAIYGVAYTLAIMLTFVITAINNSYVPWYYKKLKHGDREKNKSVSVGIAMLIAVLLLGVIAVAPEMILILASREYMEAIWVVPPVAMSLLFLFYTQLFINVEFYFEEKGMLVYGTAFSAILNIALNILLIPIFGFVVAAYTTLISYIVFALMHYKMYKKILKKHNMADNMFNYQALIGIAVLMMFLGFGFMMLYEHTVIRYTLIGMIGLVILLQRTRLLTIYHNFKGKKVESE